jgi:hypothetical protein
MKKFSSERHGLPVIQDRAAGIDIGSRFHVVAVPADLTDVPVRTFQAFTADLEQMADWLVDLGVTTVAMESTGVYWIPVYEILETHGLHVVLANARDARAVPGRKPTLTMHSGFSGYMPAGCCVLASILIERSRRYAVICVYENGTSITRLRISSTCRRRSPT